MALTRERNRSTAKATAPVSTGRTRTGRGTKGLVNLEKVVRDTVIAGLLGSVKKFDTQAIKDSDTVASSFGGEYVLEQPAYNLMALAAIVNKSNTLQQCIDAYVTNIESTGYQLVYIGPEPEDEDIDAEVADEAKPGEEDELPPGKAKPFKFAPPPPGTPPGKEGENEIGPNGFKVQPKKPKPKAPPKTGPDSAAAIEEKQRIESFLNSPNGEYSMVELRERGRRDRETVGAYVWEAVRGDDGSVATVYHLPAHTIFMTKRDNEATEISRWVRRGDELVEVKRYVHFRRYVQVVGGKRTYFREFGDPRPMHAKTGARDGVISEADAASEVIYEGNYRSGYVYGVPRYIHQLAAIEGSRESELSNLDFFKNNAIPAMVAMIAGGQLTEESLDDLKAYMTGAKGKDAQNRFLLLEVEASAKGASPKGALQPPKIDLKALNNDRQSDALFQEYDKENQKKVRSAFRLPPLFLGLSEDLNYASAKASLELSEQQVFAPERTKVDDVINGKLLLDAEGKPPMHWWVKSNPAKIVDPADIVNALEKLATVGALTPNMAITIANELFGLELEPIADPWGDVPFEATKQLMGKGMVLGFEGVLGERYPDPVAPPPFGGDPDDPDDPGGKPNEDGKPNEEGKPNPFGAKAAKSTAKRPSSPARKRAGQGGSTAAPAKKAPVASRKRA